MFKFLLYDLYKICNTPCHNWAVSQHSPPEMFLNGLVQFESCFKFKGCAYMNTHTHSCSNCGWVQHTCRTKLTGSNLTHNQTGNVATALCLRMTIVCLLKTRLITGGQHAAHTHTHTHRQRTLTHYYQWLPWSYSSSESNMKNGKTSPRWTCRGVCVCVELWVRTKECHHLMINYGVNVGWSVGRLLSHTHTNTHRARCPSGIRVIQHVPACDLSPQHSL